MNKAPISVKDALQKYRIPLAARVHKLLFFFGPSAQKDKAVKEFSELIQVMKRNYGNDDQVREKIVDAGIMLDQLRMMYDLTADQERAIRDQKLRRAEAAYYKRVTIPRADLPESDFKKKTQSLKDDRRTKTDPFGRTYPNESGE